MPNVFIAYDLTYPGQKYALVEAQIRRLGAAIKLLNTTWYVRTSLSLDQVRAQVSAVMDLGDKLLVVEAASASGWNLDQSSWQSVLGQWR